MEQHSLADFALSIVSFHEQVLGAHNFINRAQTSADTIRGYALLLEILQGFATTPVLSFDAGAIAVFDECAIATGSRVYNGFENCINCHV